MKWEILESRSRRMLHGCIGIFLATYAPDYSPLPDNNKDSLFCPKLSDTVQGKSATDVGVIKDCSAFLDFPISVPLTEVPTKLFVFKCYRPVEERRPRVDPVVILMATQSKRSEHLPPVRERYMMHGKDIVYKDLRQYLQGQGARFLHDLCISVGDEFLNYLTSALFPLSLGVWKQINDEHNRGGARRATRVRLTAPAHQAASDDGGPLVEGSDIYHSINAVYFTADYQA
jgi:hypothetical protein